MPNDMRHVSAQCLSPWYNGPMDKDGWYSPSANLVAAIRAAYEAEAAVRHPVTVDALWDRLRRQCMREPDGFERLFGPHVPCYHPRELVELSLAVGAVVGLEVDEAGQVIETW